MARIRKAREQFAIQQDFIWQILEALGYRSQSSLVQLESGVLPVIAQATLQDRPHVWVMEALDDSDSGEDILKNTLDLPQVPSGRPEATVEGLVSEAFFTEEPPRWILIISFKVFVLLDRSKWSGRRALRIGWDELYNRPTRLPTFQLIVLLLSRDSLCPTGGRSSMLDSIDQQSAKHAQGVSGSLKYALREAVELLGNEFLHYRRNVQRGAIYEGGINADQLTVEYLRYMYRLLFLFTVEAHRELAYLPMKAGAYLQGYSLEKLHDLELVQIGSNGSSDGYFIHESVQQLFALVFNGRIEGGRQIVFDGGRRTFEVAPLQCNLFDPQETPLLNSYPPGELHLLRVVISYFFRHCV